MADKPGIHALTNLDLPAGVRIVEGNGGLTKVEIRTPTAEAEIYLHGAQLTSWKPAGGQDVLFVSEKSHWETGRAIRGGVPVCFPWFRAKVDDPKAPAHGFVRTKEWQLDSITGVPDGAVRVTLCTQSDQATRTLWPFDFQLEYRITVGARLMLELTLNNTGKSAFRFEEALHTYFRVGDIERVVVTGLEGAWFLDNRDGNRKKEQKGDLRLVAQTDDAFKAQGAVEIFDPLLGRTLRTEKQNSNSTIVWNPWSDGAASLADLRPEEWRSMLCVEGGNIIDDAVWLEPDQDHKMIVEIGTVSGSNGDRIARGSGF